MIVDEKIDVRAGSQGGRITVARTVNNAPVLKLAAFYRMLAANGWKLGREVRLEAVVPVYLPQGMFAAGVNAHNLDPDQEAYLLKNCPETKVEPDATAAIKVA